MRLLKTILILALAAALAMGAYLVVRDLRRFGLS